MYFQLAHVVTQRVLLTHARQQIHWRKDGSNQLTPISDSMPNFLNLLTFNAAFDQLTRILE